MRIKIENDLYDIAARLREIDPSYGLVFNTENQRFEVTARGMTVLVLPFENLDERTLERVYYTRADNAEEVIKDLDKDNEALEKEKVKSAQDRLENEFTRLCRLRGV